MLPYERDAFMAMVMDDAQKAAKQGKQDVSSL